MSSRIKFIKNLKNKKIEFRKNSSKDKEFLQTWDWITLQNSWFFFFLKCYNEVINGNVTNQWLLVNVLDLFLSRKCFLLPYHLPVCFRVWFVRCSLRVNVFGQYVHLCGDSPVCWRTWLTKWSLRVNAFLKKKEKKSMFYWHWLSWFLYSVFESIFM